VVRIAGLEAKLKVVQPFGCLSSTDPRASVFRTDDDRRIMRQFVMSDLCLVKGAAGMRRRWIRVPYGAVKEAT
jgi:hypothetical protein